MIGTTMFGGILFAMIFIIPLSDKYGRKPLMILNAFISTIAQLGFFLYYNLCFYYVLMFLMGIGAALNPCVGYVYVMELVPKKK